MSTSKDSPLARIKGFQDSIKKESEAVKIELAKGLQHIADIVKGLAEIGITNVFADPQYGQALDEAGLMPVGLATVPAPIQRLRKAADKATGKGGKGGTRAPRAKFTFADAAKFIGEERKNTKEIVKALKTTPITASKFLKLWESEGKVKKEKDGVSVFWSVAKK